MKVIMVLLGLIVPFSSYAADFTISLKSGKDLVVYKKSNNLKLGTVVLMPGGNSLIKVANGELLHPSLSFIYFETLSNCQANSGNKYYYDGQLVGAIIQNPRGSEYLKITSTRVSLLGAYYYDKDSLSCVFNDNPVAELYNPLQIQPSAGFPNLGDAIGRGVSESEIFEIRAE